jgi:hypothetical protein
LAAVPTVGLANLWTRRSLPTKVDPTSLIAAGSHTNSWRPIAGSYLVRFWGYGFKIESHCVRLATSTSNTTSTVITELVGNIAWSNSGANYADNISQGSGILTTAGATDFCLDHIFSVANATDGFGRAANASGGAPGAAFAAALVGHLPKVCGIDFHFLGTP